MNHLDNYKKIKWIGLLILPLSIAGCGDENGGGGARSTDIANSVALQSDGKIVAAGASFNGADYDFALVRYHTDGSLDTTFNTTGKVTTPVGNSNDIANSVVVQSDGKIVAAGYSYNGADYDFALVRYNTDGSLDTTFNATGMVTTPIGSGSDIAHSVGLQSDGKIVAAGTSFNGISYDFALVRYNTDGSLDTTFNTTGKVTTPIGNSSEVAYSVVLQSDGKIVAGGTSIIGVQYDFALVRYNTDGSLDTAFNNTGKVTTSIGGGSDIAHSLALQSDGKILAGGYSFNGTNYDFALVRYNTDGSLDTTFNNTGKVTTPIGNSNEVVNSVLVQSDGKIVAAGTAIIGIADDFALVRYNTDGSLDTAFNATGKVTTSIGSGDDDANSAVLQSDEKIVAAGYSYNGRDDDFALVRYNTDGSLDTTFNATGKVTTPIGSSN